MPRVRHKTPPKRCVYELRDAVTKETIMNSGGKPIRIRCTPAQIKHRSRFVGATANGWKKKWVKVKV